MRRSFWVWCIAGRGWRWRGFSSSSGSPEACWPFARSWCLAQSRDFDRRQARRADARSAHPARESAGALSRCALRHRSIACRSGEFSRVRGSYRKKTPSRPADPGLFRSLYGRQARRAPMGRSLLAKKDIISFLYRLHMSLALPASTGSLGGYILGVTALVWTIDCFVSFYLTFPLSRRERASSSAKSWWSRWKPAWLIKFAPAPIESTSTSIAPSVCGPGRCCSSSRGRASVSIFLKSTRP